MDAFRYAAMATWAHVRRRPAVATTSVAQQKCITLAVLELATQRRQRGFDRESHFGRDVQHARQGRLEGILLKRLAAAREREGDPEDSLVAATRGERRQRGLRRGRRW